MMFTGSKTKAFLRSTVLLSLAISSSFADAAAETPAPSGKVADHYLLCLLHLRDSDPGLVDARDNDPKADAAKAAAAGDYRPAGFRHADRVEALGTTCAKTLNAFSAVLGFDKTPYDACMTIYVAEAKPYVTNYNHALIEAAKPKAVDICAAP